ncbi:MAG: LacI family DNA-binding transcriptional regulator [Eubacteriales bacterium]|nr:LacI family DNA-binding transcriptional regulator [Eubacteriales bacterium]
MTIQKLAEECGVSASTVSRALNGDPDVKDAVREKIVAAAVRSDYCKPDRKHKKKKSGKRYIAVIACPFETVCEQRKIK